MHIMIVGLLLTSNKQAFSAKVVKNRLTDMAPKSAKIATHTINDRLYSIKLEK